MTAAEKKAWLDKCWVTYVDVGFGCRQYMLFTPEMIAPIGFVWVTAVGGKVSSATVLSSYTRPYFRRRGARTRLNEELFKSVEIIQTKQGSKEGGAAFLKASGYTHDPIRDDWYLLAKPKTKAAKRRKVAS
jgi:hypothetical protein